jgi:hypothetical protein
VQQIFARKAFCFVMKRQLQLMEMSITSERREEIVIGMVKEMIECYSERKVGLCSEVTTSIGGRVRGGTHGTMFGPSINFPR